jgi:hypothetical protein
VTSTSYQSFARSFSPISRASGIDGGSAVCIWEIGAVAFRLRGQ